MSDDTATLRKHLFDTLAGLKDKSIDIEHAKAINETAQTIINVAKVEVDYMKVTGATLSDSLVGGPQQLPAPGAGGTQTGVTQTGFKTTTQLPGATVTQHRMRG